jgi:hypothetical protein
MSGDDWIQALEGQWWACVSAKIVSDTGAEAILDEIVTGWGVNAFDYGVHSVAFDLGGCVSAAVWPTVSCAYGGPVGFGQINTVDVLPRDLHPLMAGPSQQAFEALVKATQDVAAQNIDLSFDNGRFIYSIRSKDVTE